jgi:hypothetical protein
MRVLAELRRQHQQLQFHTVPHCAATKPVKYTEAVDADGKKTKGLGPGVAEMIATMIGTRNAAQVRSHAQKYFTRQRRDMGLC